uniref:Predicted protein n=1 Tax=Hordeum vulgare subsp. vulgare TaxID=112509 RepID=F2DBX1_HORVV|nr:predicted protein [Hordeum vulgare subsp. vulgare]BAJ99539.1 predicted protein [Hordeum vulgare subsp. vulgare]
MALLKNLAAYLCVILASLAFVAQGALAARGALSNVRGYTVKDPRGGGGYGNGYPP